MGKLWATFAVLVLALAVLACGGQPTPDIEATETAVFAKVMATLRAMSTPTPTDTALPTDTPGPTDTPTPKPTATMSPEMQYASAFLPWRSDADLWAQELFLFIRWAILGAGVGVDFSCKPELQELLDEGADLIQRLEQLEPPATFEETHSKLVEGFTLINGGLAEVPKACEMEGMEGSEAIRKGAEIVQQGASLYDEAMKEMQDWGKAQLGTPTGTPRKPTLTLSPTHTPTPENTATPKPPKVGSRSNPLPMGQPIEFTTSSKEHIRLTLTRVVRGAEAEAIRNAGAQFLHYGPGEGNEFLLAYFAAEYLDGPQDEPWSIDWMDFSSEVMNVLSTFMTTWDKEIGGVAYPGGTLAGWVELRVPIGTLASDIKIRYNPTFSDIEFWFAVQ